MPRQAKRTIAIILAAVAVSITTRESVDGRPTMALHTELVSSNPADGDLLTASPAAVRLVFSDPVEPTLSIIRLVTADGAQLEFHPSSEDGGRVLVARLPGLANGNYTIEWSTVSVGGHKVEGRLTFRVAREGLSIDTPPETDVTPSDETSQPSSNGGIVGIGLLSGVALGALLALAGLLIHMAWLGANDPGKTRRVAGVLALVTPLLLAAHTGAWVQSIAPGKIDTATIMATLSTTAGRIVALRLALAIVAGVALVVLRKTVLAAGLAFFAVAIGGALGHAAEFYPAVSIPIKTIHLTAVALWLGGLIMLAVCGLRATGFQRAAHQTSKLALWAVTTIVVTGFAQSVLIAGSPINLLGTRYGALLIAKTGGVIGLVMFGALNRTRLLPKLDLDSRSEPLTRSVRWEAVLMILILIVAGLLAATPPPGG